MLQLELLSGKAAFVGVHWKFLDGKEILCEGAAPAWCAVSELLPAPTSHPAPGAIPEPRFPPFLWDCVVTVGTMGSWAVLEQPLSGFPLGAR